MPPARRPSLWRLSSAMARTFTTTPTMANARAAVTATFERAVVTDVMMDKVPTLSAVIAKA